MPTKEDKGNAIFIHSFHNRRPCTSIANQSASVIKESRHMDRCRFTVV